MSKKAAEVPIETAVASAASETANSTETVKPCEHLAPYQFQPGQSGNPGGRPKKKVITEIYERLLEDGAFVRDVENSIRKMVQSGRMVGQLQLKEMAERTEGKVSQPLEGEFTILSLAERMRKARERTGS